MNVGFGTYRIRRGGESEVQGAAETREYIMTLIVTPERYEPCRVYGILFLSYSETDVGAVLWDCNASHRCNRMVLLLKESRRSSSY